MRLRKKPKQSKTSPYFEGSIGDLMEPPHAVFVPEQTVGDAIDALREMVKTALITYAWVLEADGRLVGVVTMRDLLFSDRSQKLRDVMLKSVFALNATTPLIDAMKSTLDKHYPEYPVVDDEGRLKGTVRGAKMFEAQAVELSAQAGEMVGVTKEERLATPWPRSLLFRHPWLQLNLLTAFVAAAVVGAFEGTLEKIVLLAVFLPVLAGQSGNTGCQALAVTLRGMTLNELHSGIGVRLMLKEAWLGLLNGMLVGVVASLGMFAMAHYQHNPHAATLALITFTAMSLSSVASGMAGAAVPLGLKRIGADPAMASSIFLTTATDVVSMGLFLGMATWLLI